MKMNPLRNSVSRCTCIYFLFWVCLPSSTKPVETLNSDTHSLSDGLGPTSNLWIALASSFLFVTVCFVVCVCCRKTPGFTEFRGSTQLAELTQNHQGGVTLFPPPSLALSRDDLDVRFEPLPHLEPKNSHTYRSKEIIQWIENGLGLFPRYKIQYLREVGRGWFGQVVEAEVKDLIQSQVSSRCVVKILKPEATAAQQVQFLNDVQPLSQLSHPHVLKLYGCSLETSPLLVLLQHCANGDLKQFLIAYGNSKITEGMPPLPENVLLRMAWEAAEGLLQWHNLNLYHPDVAARSFMVTSDMRVVIGDYGTNLHSYKEDFCFVGDSPVPVRWCAPECYSLTSGILVNKAGNIWSFGILLWEMLSLGCRPYGFLSDEQVVQQVILDKRTVLNPPALNYQQGQVPFVIYQLMVQCWEVDCQLRPTMEDIVSRLASAYSGVVRDIERDLEQAFDSRWSTARPNKDSPSASLNNLHGSLDDLTGRKNPSLGASIDDDLDNGFSAKVSAALRSLDEALAAAGTGEEDVILPEPMFRIHGNQLEQDDSSSSSLLSSRSWQEKVTRGELTALVREKSRSVQDLMVLTHVEPLSDVEFIAQGLKERESSSLNSVPHISVSSGMNGDSDVPLLDSTDANTKGEHLLGTFMNHNRTRLTSTPRDDTNFSAMESSFRDQLSVKTKDYEPFSPESLDATKFTQKNEQTPTQQVDSSTSIILGPSEDLGLDVYQGITTTQNDEEVYVQPAVQDHVHLQVNLEAWNQFLEQAYAEQEPFEEPDDIGDIPVQSKDSGIARPSFNSSVDILGSSFENDSALHVAVDKEGNIPNYLLATKLWSKEIAQAIANNNRMDFEEQNTSLNDTDPNLEDSKDLSQISEASESESSPRKLTARNETYYSYGKIDEDINEDGSPKHDLSTIREERESVSSSETAATPAAETGRSLVAQLQMKNRLQRSMELSDSSDSSDPSDDEEEVLVVDLETKRAILVEAQSPKLKAAIAAEDYEEIFDIPTVKDTPSSDVNVVANGFGDMERSSLTDDDKVYTPDWESESENGEDKGNDLVEFDDEDEEDENDEGIVGSSFVWQASYPLLINQSLSMDVIEEGSEEDEDQEEHEEIIQTDKEFVPSTWKSDATPTKSSIKSPENTSSLKKSVSFSKLRTRQVYEYPEENEEPITPSRRQWKNLPSPEASYASFADWDFAVEDEKEFEADKSSPLKDLEGSSDDIKPIIPRPLNPLPNNLLYRLSDIDNEELEEKDVVMGNEEDEFYQGEWASSFQFSEFQPNHYFTNWEDPPEAPPPTDEEQRSPVGTLRHTLNSLRLDLPPSRSESET